MEEEWVDIPDWPDYSISNFGDVLSHRTGKILKTSPDRYGYPSVNLSRYGDWKRIAVHRLVALSFVQGYFEGAEVKHKDGDKQNNHFENLMWVTHYEATKFNPGRPVKSTSVVQIITPEDRGLV